MKNLKKLTALLLAMSMAFALAACGSTSTTTSASPSASTSTSTDAADTADLAVDADTTAGAYLALVTDVGNIDDQSFNQSSYEGMVAFAEANDMDYDYFQPSEDSTASRVETIGSAVDAGATAIVLPGYMFTEAIAQVQDKYPEVMFLGIDVTTDDVESYGVTLGQNVTLVTYKEEQSGYLAGYAAVMDGYTELGFLGGMDVPAVIRFGFGYVQGADDAAAELGVDVTMKYWYGGTFGPDDNVKVKMDSWYADGTEIVFACGGGIWLSAAAAAEAAGGVLIGTDVDQGPQSDLIVTSAMKELGNSIQVLLTDLYTDGNGVSWSSTYAGTQSVLGAAEGAVGLPTVETSWRLENYTVAEYEEVLAKVVSGEIEISDATDAAPAVTTITVDYQS